MKRDFKIVDGIYLVQGNYELDLHNNFTFTHLDYSVEQRSLVLHWKRATGDWVSSNIPSSITVKFTKVSEFRFIPRTPDTPFTEDDCMNSFGYWVDEDWADGVIIVSPSQKAEPDWLTAIDFMSGAVLAVQAEEALANVIE